MIIVAGQALQQRKAGDLRGVLPVQKDFDGCGIVGRLPEEAHAQGVGFGSHRRGLFRGFQVAHAPIVAQETDFLHVNAGLVLFLFA